MFHAAFPKCKAGLISTEFSGVWADTPLSEPQLRRRIRRGLLEVDQLHACSSLTLLPACIIYWQAKEIDRVLNECDP
jgi:hypothetical protein